MYGGVRLATSLLTGDVVSDAEARPRCWWMSWSRGRGRAQRSGFRRAEAIQPALLLNASILRPNGLERRLKIVWKEDSFFNQSPIKIPPISGDLSLAFYQNSKFQAESMGGWTLRLASLSIERNTVNKSQTIVALPLTILHFIPHVANPARSDQGVSRFPFMQLQSLNLIIQQPPTPNTNRQRVLRELFHGG